RGPRARVVRRGEENPMSTRNGSGSKKSRRARDTRTPAAPSNGAHASGPESFRLKVGLAEMLKGGVIMDVMTPDQARIAEEAGAAAVMALERIPSRIRREGGVARMSDPKLIQEIQAAVSIPVMAKCRIG